ncbi:hypothetical protein VPH35_077804 [Triticum aestivum]
MGESQSIQDCSKFGAFVHRIPGAELGNVGDMMIHYTSGSTSQAGGAKMRRPLPSPRFTMYDSAMIASNKSVVEFPSDGLPDEQSLASAFGDMSLKNYTADSLTSTRDFVPVNGYYPSGPANYHSGITPPDVTLNPSLVPAIVQDDLTFCAEHVNQKPDELTVGQQEQAYRFPPLFENFPMGSVMHDLDSFSSAPYHQSALSTSPIEQQFYLDVQSQLYAPYGQPFDSNIMWQHGTETPRCTMLQPHYVYPQLQQVAGSDVRRSRRHQQAAACTSANGTLHIETPNIHRQGMGIEDPYSNGAAFQKRNTQLNSFHCTLSADSPCGSSNFRQQVDKFYSLSNGFSRHNISDNISTVSYPEKLWMRADGVNSVRSTRSTPVDGCIGRDGRTSSAHNHLDIHSNFSLHPDRPNSQLLPLVMKPCELNYNSVDEVAGRIYMLAKDQNGCRFLQKVFAQGSQEDVERVFAEIIDHIGELMVDPFGNYLVQKLLEGCSDDQRMRILCEVTKTPGDLIAVSCNMHGYEQKSDHLLYSYIVIASISYLFGKKCSGLVQCKR